MTYKKELIFKDRDYIGLELSKKLHDADEFIWKHCKQNPNRED